MPYYTYQQAQYKYDFIFTKCDQYINLTPTRIRKYLLDGFWM